MAFIGGQADTRQEGGATQVGAATVRGRVVADLTRAPLRKVRVALVFEGRLRAVFTDGEGRFVFTQVPSGSYTLNASKSGYVTTTLADGGVAGHPAIIRAVEGTEVDNVEIRLPKGAALAGRITDAFGDPLSGAPVLVDAEPPPTGAAPTASVARTTTDDLGEYRVGGLAAGKYLVRASASFGMEATMIIDGRPIRASNAAAFVYYPGVADVRAAQAVALAAGEDRWGVDIAISGIRTELIVVGDTFGPADSVLPRSPDPAASSVIRGQIFSVDGRALAHANVVLTARMPRQRPRFASADDRGQYEFANLAAGVYDLRGGKSGYLSWEFGQRRPFERGEPILLDGRESRARVDITLPRSSTISGHIADEYGQPIQGATVRALHTRFIQGRRRLVEAPGVPPRRTDDLGFYRLSGLLPGQYVVSATVGQVETFQPTQDLAGYGTTYAPGTANLTEARPLAVDVAQDLTNVDFPLTPLPTARIAGTAHWSNGDPVTGGLKLTFSSRSAAVVTEMGARIDPDGSFEFPNLAPGEYVVQAYKGRVNSWTEGEFVTHRTLVSGSDVTGLELDASRGSAITGRITLLGDNTLRPTDLELAPVPTDPDLSPVLSGIAHAEIQDDWTFRLAGITGSRRLGLRRAPASWTLEAVRVGGMDVTDTPIQFGTESQSLKDVEVVLTNRITRLAGRVTDDRGRPISDVSVIAFTPNREQWYAESRFLTRVPADGGGFTIAGLPPGDYCVVTLPRPNAKDDDGWQDPDVLDALISRAMRVTLAEGQTQSVILTMPRR